MSEISKHCNLPSEKLSLTCPEGKLSFPWSSESQRSAEVSLQSRVFVHLFAQWDVILLRLENVDHGSLMRRWHGICAGVHLCYHYAGYLFA